MVNNKRFIFLDFDGVINTYKYIDDNNEIHRCPLPESYVDEVTNRIAVQRINKLAKLFQMSIVVTSSWRAGVDCHKVLINSGLDHEVMFDGITTFLDSRPREIQAYLNKHPYEAYIIFDDIGPMDELEDNFILVDYRYGITNADIDKAINIINQQIKAQ